MGQKDTLRPSSALKEPATKQQGPCQGLQGYSSWGLASASPKPASTLPAPHRRFLDSLKAPFPTDTRLALLRDWPSLQIGRGVLLGRTI